MTSRKPYRPASSMFDGTFKAQDSGPTKPQQQDYLSVRSVVWFFGIALVVTAVLRGF